MKPQISRNSWFLIFCLPTAAFDYHFGALDDSKNALAIAYTNLLYVTGFTMRICLTGMQC